MSRIDATPAQKREISERFGFECAGCDQAGRLATDVAHLFEDAPVRKPRADTLIVLCSICNQAEARAKYGLTPPLEYVLDADSVSAHARGWYRKGRYSRAYAGHRLAAYLYEKQGGFHSKAVACLIEAISSLRPIRWGDFLNATLREVERLCLSSPVGDIQRWLVLDRFALVLYDYRLWRLAAAVQHASRQIRAELDVDLRYPDKLRFDRASSFRREALIRASTGLESGRRSLERIHGRLLEDAKEFERLGLFDAYATNIDVASKLALEIRRSAKTAHLLSEKALEYAAKVTHKWVLQEHYWREAEYYHSKKDRDLMLQSMTKALEIFQAHPVILEPTLSAQGPIAHDPIAELDRYGIREAEFRERKVAPSRNTPAEVPLGLSTSRINRLVANVSRGTGSGVGML